MTTHKRTADSPAGAVPTSAPARPGRSGRIRPRRIASASIVAVAAACVLSGCSGNSAESASQSSPPAASTDSGSGVTVQTKLLSFDPQKVSVKAGTKVTWRVSDSIAHTVTTGTFTLGGDGLRTEQHPDGMVDMPFGPGHETSFTFSKPGNYTYYCSIHKGMTGEVDVTS